MEQIEKTSGALRRLNTKQNRFIIDYSKDAKDKLLSQPLKKTVDAPYSPFRYNENVAERLVALQEFLFCPNNGNLGDAVIAEAEYQFLRHVNSNYSIFDVFSEKTPEKSTFNFVYGGGGLFVKYHNYQEILDIFKSPNLKRCIVLSASFFECDDLIEVFDGRFTVFCRDKRSYQYCVGRNKNAEFILSDDMVFNLDMHSATKRNSGHITENIVKLSDKYLNVVYANYSYYIAVRTKIIEHLSAKTIISNEGIRM
jgi:exopolysaccharide biosynthesis predicted pyruvyltransferase EpsI